jgi:uncharacterized membrane protein YqiK
MTGIVLVIGLFISAAILAAASKLQDRSLKAAAALLAIVVFAAFFVLSSVRFVGAEQVGIVVKNVLGPKLKEGRIIATGGEMGVQAAVLPPGWHFGYWPIIYDVSEVPLVKVPAGQVGLIEARDGLPLDEGQLFAPDFPRDEFQKMLDASYFLTTGNGRKGKQASVLTPGSYRINTELFTVTMVEQTEVAQGEVAVLKANYGKPPTIVVRGAAGAADPSRDAADVSGDDELIRLAEPGEMGVRAEPLPPGKYPINTDAYTVMEMWSTQMIAHFTAGRAGTGAEEEQDIMVRTSDGFTFPVDVRIEYVIEPRKAPIVVAKLGDDEGERFKNALNSAVRAIFRNNAEGVRALDYVQQRSHQESQSLKMLSEQMARFGVTVTAVRIGNVGDEKTLGALLKTQTDREIAKQELLTFQEQQKAAEQKKQLSRTTQESEEEKRLATAAYQVKIADEEKRRKVIEAGAEAEAIAIKAQANAALVELLKIIGERNIQITPRVMVVNGSGANGQTAGQAETTALIGTMLDSMISRDEPESVPRPAPPPSSPSISQPTAARPASATPK